MSDKIGEFIPVFGWVIHSQQLEMIGGRLVWIIFLLAKLNLSLADKWGQTWISMDRDAGFFCFCFFPFSKMQPDCQSLVKKNLCFWETQTLSSVFSIRTLKIIKQPCNAMSHEDSYFGGVYLERMPDAYFLFFLPHFFFGLSFVVLCFTFLWVAILNSMRRAASVWGAPYTLCIYLHFKIVLNKLKRLPDKLKSHPPLPSC